MFSFKLEQPKWHHWPMKYATSCSLDVEINVASRHSSFAVYEVIYCRTIVRVHLGTGERGGSVVECRIPEREVWGSKPTSAVLCPWARHFTPRKYWLITQEAVAPSRHDWKIVDWDVKPQHKQTNI